MKFLKITLLLLLILSVSGSFAQSIIGTWKTIDDETGKAKSFVEIYMKDGKAFGKITKLIVDKGENENPICTECTDNRKGKHLIGMNVITDMVKDGNEWEDGEIMDPNNGKIYDCKLWVEDGELQVRGYIAFFFRTQTWLKAD